MQTNDPVDDANLEFDRQRRLVDQLITMQARLRDWNQFGAFLLTGSTLIASIVGVAFAFAANSEEITIGGVTAQRTTWLGWLAVAATSVTVMDLVLDRRGAARSRADAVHILSELKGEYRSPLSAGSEVEQVERISAKYAATMTTVPPVPDLLFNHLKSVHLRKVEISKIISERPGISLLGARWILKKRVRE